MNRRNKTLIAAFAVCGVALTFTGCKEEGSAEKAGAKVDKAAEKAGEKTGEALNKAGDSVKDATK